MKSSLLDVARTARSEVEREIYGDYGWMVDFEPDSVINMRLRKKKDVTSFALNNEGNIYNNLINKVKLYFIIAGIVCISLFLFIG